jgi:hypothetical protein
LFEVVAGGVFVAGAKMIGVVDVGAGEEALEDFGAFGVEDFGGDVGVFFADGGFVFLEAGLALAEDGEVDVADEIGVGGGVWLVGFGDEDEVPDVQMRSESGVVSGWWVLVMRMRSRTWAMKALGAAASARRFLAHLALRSSLSVTLGS